MATGIATEISMADILAIDTGYPPGTRLRVLKRVSRGAALSSKSMNGRMTEVAAVTFPRSANQRVGGQRSKVTGVSAGGLVGLPSFEDRS